MRLAILIGVLVLALAAGAVSASAAAVAPASAAHAAMQTAGPTQQSGSAAVPSNDDSRVAVQWGVFGAAAFTVVVVGIGAYLLRKRLGLVAPPPDQGSDAHH
jgi:hypothetical protein